MPIKPKHTLTGGRPLAARQFTDRENFIAASQEIAALKELQAKNRELEQLMERNSLLREELGQQERLAVAGHGV